MGKDFHPTNREAMSEPSKELMEKWEKEAEGKYPFFYSLSTHHSDDSVIAIRSGYLAAREKAFKEYGERLAELFAEDELVKRIAELEGLLREVMHDYSIEIVEVTPDLASRITSTLDKNNLKRDMIIYKEDNSPDFETDAVKAIQNAITQERSRLRKIVEERLGKAKAVMADMPENWPTVKLSTEVYMAAQKEFLSLLSEGETEEKTKE